MLQYSDQHRNKLSSDRRKLVHNRGLAPAPVQTERKLRELGSAPIEMEDVVNITLYINNESL